MFREYFMSESVMLPVLIIQKWHMADLEMILIDWNKYIFRQIL
jgi:hypothetical protein